MLSNIFRHSSQEMASEDDEVWTKRNMLVALFKKQ